MLNWIKQFYLHNYNLTMKKIATILTILVSATWANAQHTHTPMETEIDSVSYSIGMNIASSLLNGGIDTLNFDIFLEAVKDVMVESHVKMDGNTANAIINAYAVKAQQKKSQKVIDEGIRFLSENATKEGVKTTPSGLQYKIITQGTGPIPVDGQTVKTHYKGTLIDGSVFDSSYDKGTPVSFGVNGVIRGWTEALKMMPVGSKWELYIPQDLAYGERAMGAKIPAYSTLIFTIELLEIVE